MGTPAGRVRLGREDRLVMAVLFGLFAVAVGNTTSSAAAMPAIGTAFHTGPANAGWVVFGYSGMFAVATSVYGVLARRYGLARALVAGVLLVALGGVITVLSVDLPMLVAGRAVQGLGGGAFPPLSMTLIARRLSGPARPRAIGINIAAVGVGFALGPLLGGLALETVGWRGATALGLLAAPAAPLLWRLESRWDQPDKGASLDILGIVLVAVVVSCLTLLLNRGPILGVSVITSGAAAGLVVGGSWLVHHLRTTARPVFPRSVLTDRRLWALMLLGLIGQAAFLGTLVVIPVAAASVHGLSGFTLGLILLPTALVVALLSPRNGRVQELVGQPATTTFALLVISVGTLALAGLGAGTSPYLLVAGITLGAVGFSFLNAPLANRVTHMFPADTRPLALGMYNLAFFMGTTSGAGLSTALVQTDLAILPFPSRPLPGYSTALVVIAAVPLVVGVSRTIRGALARGRSRLCSH